MYVHSSAGKDSNPCKGVSPHPASVRRETILLLSGGGDKSMSCSSVVGCSAAGHVQAMCRVSVQFKLAYSEIRQWRTSPLCGSGLFFFFFHRKTEQKPLRLLR